MTARRTWIDRVSDGLFNVSFDRMLRDLIMAYRKRKSMSARQFGTEALGDSAFIGHRLRRGGSVALKTADKVLEFMGEPPFGPWFRCEVEAYIAMTGCKAHLLGYYAVGDPSFVSRLRRGASPRLSTVDRIRAWMGANLRTMEEYAIKAAMARRDSLRVGGNARGNGHPPPKVREARPMEDHPEYLTTREAGLLLGMSVRTLERYRITGGGPRFCKFGRKVRYLRSDVDEWAKRRMRNSTSDDGSD